MINAFLKAIKQLKDQKIRKFFWISFISACFVFLILWIVIGTLLEATRVVSIDWLEWLFDFLGGLTTIYFTWILFPPVISWIICYFISDIADVIEMQHYPNLQKSHAQSILSAHIIAIRNLGVLILLNIILLIFLIFGPLYPFIFYSVNGYILGREYFELIAQRRLDKNATKELYKLHRSELFIAGMVSSILLTLPLINLIAPIFIVAFMIHLLEEWQKYM